MAVPVLDRRITLHLTTSGDRNEVGRWVPGVTVDVPVWAMRADEGVTLNQETQGVRHEAVRRWRVRWREDLAAALPSGVELTDGATRYQATAMRELTDEGRFRRRWIEIDVVGGAAGGGTVG